jgi:glycosyltransferase involved in cell wall biosynthesis
MKRRSKRVVHVTTVHNAQDPRISRKEVGALAEAGYDVHLVAPASFSSTSSPDDMRSGAGCLYALPNRSGRAWRLTLQPHAFRAVQRLEPDLIHFHDPELFICAYLLKATTGAQVVYDMHEDYGSRGGLVGKMLRGLERWGFTWLDHVVTAEDSYARILDDTPVAFTRVANYHKPFGSAGQRRRSPGPENREQNEGPVHLLYTGTISEDRGLFTMIDLARRIREEGRPERIRVVGICRIDEQREEADRQIRAGRLDNVFERVGWDAFVPPERMVPFYRQADVGLVLCDPTPNYVESIPTKFYECLHYDVPIICTGFPLWERFVEENDCGATVPPGDAGAVIDVLDRWRTNPDLYRSRAKGARRASQRYRWEEEAGRLVRLYDRLLAPPQVAACNREADEPTSS